MRERLKLINKVKIYGAGSIGNHLAHACRNKGWDAMEAALQTISVYQSMHTASQC